MYEERKKKIVDLLKEHSEPLPSSSGQHAVGNNNIQIGEVSKGGQVTVVRGPALDPNNPELMPCPVCSRLVSHTASECPDCYDNLAARRHRARQQAIQMRKLKFCAACFLLAGLSWGIGHLFPGYSGTTMVITALLLLAGMNVAK